jgi:RNA polymerase sigma factor (sigma-70 family)
LTSTSETRTEADHPLPVSFTTTQWTQVLEACEDSVEGRAALGDLCAAYYAPVFTFIRRCASDEDTARDLTQEFFARLLAGRGIATVDPQRGRFRSYLLGAVKHFLADARDQDHRLKRGAGQPMESIDLAADTSPALQLPDPTAPSPEREFDRKWALTVLGHALATLAEEHKAAGSAKYFEALKPWLTGEPESLTQADAGRRLGMSEGAVTVAIHRLRRRFRGAVKGEIARTLHDPAQVDDELTCLVAALGGR